jgi:hypothetical protein
MAKSTKKYNPDVTTKASLIEDDYEDFGYDISNAKRYQNRNKSQRKFKDYTDYDD